MSFTFWPSGKSPQIATYFSLKQKMSHRTGKKGSSLNSEYEKKSSGLQAENNEIKAKRLYILFACMYFHINMVSYLFNQEKNTEFTSFL